MATTSPLDRLSERPSARSTRWELSTGWLPAPDTKRCRGHVWYSARLGWYWDTQGGRRPGPGKEREKKRESGCGANGKWKGKKAIYSISPDSEP